MMWSLLALGAMVLGLPVQQGEVAPRFPAAVETEASRIFNSMMSPYCPGLLIANCPSPGAADLKARVKTQLAAGVSPESVRAMSSSLWTSEPSTHWGISSEASRSDASVRTSMSK